MHDFKIDVKTLQPNLPFWKFKELVIKAENCRRYKEYYSKKYGHYIQYYKTLSLLEVKDA